MRAKASLRIDKVQYFVNHLIHLSVEIIKIYLKANS